MSAHIRIVALDGQQKARLEGMLRRGRWTPRQLKRARILLMANEHKTWSNTAIGKEVHAGRETARSIRNRFLDEGLDAALFDRPRPGQPRKLTDKDEALIIATSCSDAPQGCDHWTLVLLKKKLKQIRRTSVSTECIRQVLLRNKLKPWRKKNVVYSKDYAGV
jgi:transposase